MNPYSNLPPGTTEADVDAFFEEPDEKQEWHDTLEEEGE